MSIWEKLLAEAAVREPRRPFDVAAGLRRLAVDAGYVRPAGGECRTAPARRKLEVMAGWGLSQAGAAAHVMDLTETLQVPGESPARFTGWTDPLDIDGFHVFACSLYLAHHPDSARFWWQLAAGAGHLGAAYCLHLHHLSCGETSEAALWRDQVAGLLEEDQDDTLPEGFIAVLENFTAYRARTRTRTPVPTGGLEAEFARMTEDDHGGIVGPPDRRLAQRLQELAGRG
ncbi:hypothetical protein NX801_08800 [Streptomyces sp. LP05-1]|uniref:Uncharacterized protein n=1 Tax=Streptomyces pyxinae TaxID=2970734 RepID=A0ABT2CEL2_9ACTN|nr:hypothetical protein [Streptomyces sp. LP05-1]MCS0635760.1 hypothetical protein [Streptomyces sp. LP05-1]